MYIQNTVDGRNPAPPGMYKSLQIMGYLPYQLVGRISSIDRMFVFLNGIPRIGWTTTTDHLWEPIGGHPTSKIRWCMLSISTGEFYGNSFHQHYHEPGFLLFQALRFFLHSSPNNLTDVFVFNNSWVAQRKSNGCTWSIHWEPWGTAAPTTRSQQPDTEAPHGESDVRDRWRKRWRGFHGN